MKPLCPPRRSGPALAAGLLLLLPSLAGAGGFELQPSGIKAMGTAGAYTAIADDPSAVYYNIGGLALIKKKVVTVGAATVTLNESLYQGLSPGIGAGTTGEQDPEMQVPAHLYTALPFGSRAKIGLGVNSPFGLDTAWSDPDSFPGRFISQTAQLRTYDVDAGLSFAVTPRFGIGAGAVYRVSDLSSGRRLSSFDPVSGTTLDVATVEAGTDFDSGIGWNVGLLSRFGKDRFSWGLTYRSPIEIEYQGAARLTQILTGNAQVDALVQATLPLNQNVPIASRVQFPGTASMGFGIGITRSLLTEVDVSWTGWSDFDGLGIAFVNTPGLSYPLQGTWEDAYSYRVGLRFAPRGGAQWRFGYAFEETPQPDSNLGPFLPDANRQVLALGWGLDWLDIAVQWLQWEDRTTLSNVDGLNGTYRTNGWAVGLSVSR